MKTRWFCVAILGIATLVGSARGQVKRPFSTDGTVKEFTRGSLVMNDQAGRSWLLRIAGPDGAVQLSNNRKFPARPPVVEITGTLGKKDLQKGMPVQFECYMSDKGQVGGPVDEIRWMDESKFKQGIKQNRNKTNDQGYLLSQVSGTIDRVDDRGFMLRVRSRLTKKGTLAVPMAEDVQLIVKSRDLGRIREGDAITQAQGVELLTGDFVVQKLAVRMRGKSSATSSRSRDRATDSRTASSVADAQSNGGSEETVPPRLIRDTYLPMKTDLSDRRARMLLEELHGELQMLSQCFHRKPTAPIQLQVIANESQWTGEQLSDELRALLKQGEGQVVTPGEAGGARRGQAVTLNVPAKTPEIRARLVHAYLQQQFGSVGPDWFSEGMSEVGKYASQPANEVRLDAGHLKTLSRAKEPKAIADIIKAEEATAADDTANLSAADRRRLTSRKAREARERKAYRWALCFMLAHHPNYQNRFVTYATKMLGGREVSFDDAFEKVSKQLQFEFDQFTFNVANGYRMDLTAWKWTHRFRELGSGDKHKETVQAMLGWQPLVLVEAGASYDVVSQGSWTIDGTGTQTTGDGDDKGVGRLTAVVLSEEYRLSEPIPIGKAHSFTAPISGRLYVRCDEPWGGLADNSGQLVVHIRPSKKR